MSVPIFSREIVENWRVDDVRWRAGDVKNSTGTIHRLRDKEEVWKVGRSGISNVRSQILRSQITDLRYLRSQSSETQNLLLAHGAVGGTMASELGPAL